MGNRSVGELIRSSGWRGRASKGLLMVFLMATVPAADLESAAAGRRSASLSNSASDLSPLDPVIEEPIRPLLPDDAADPVRPVECGAGAVPLAVFALSFLLFRPADRRR